MILGRSLQYGLEPRGILQLLVRIRILVRLERGDRVVCPQLCAHFREDCSRSDKAV